jgi:hypothetical protein
MNSTKTALLALIVLSLAAVPASAQMDAGTLDKEDVAFNEPDYSPFVDRHVPDRVSWEVPMVVQDRAYTSPIWYTL